MKTALFTLIVLASVGAQAIEKDTAGSKCGFVDSYLDDKVVKVGEPKRIKASADLNELESAQIIQAALTLSQLPENSSVPEIDRAVDALMAASQTGEIQVQDVTIKQKEFTQVVYFPGGSPVGAIFPKGTKEIKALIQDTLIVCN